jgi:peptidyl-prolyl cis-trans isomerase C
MPANKPVATVNGDVITYGQLEPLLKQAGPLPDNLPETARRELYREALSSLIDDLLLTQYLHKYVPPASAADVDRQMIQLVSGLKEKKMTLAELCKESQQSEAQIRSDIADDLQWNAFADKHITEQQLQQYYVGCKDFFDKVTVRASHIVLRVPPTASAADKQAARARLQELRAQILAGKLDFAEAAKKNSQCVSAPKGGDIGNFVRKFVVDENFARVAFSMKPGEVSDVVESSFGLHLIKVTERTPGTPSDYNKIRPQVREVYMWEMKLGLLAQLRKDAKIEILLP